MSWMCSVASKVLAVYGMLKVIDEFEPEPEPVEVVVVFHHIGLGRDYPK